MPGTAVIAGIGPGFCEDFAWKLAREGHPVAFFARTESYVQNVESELQNEGFDAMGRPVDLTDQAEVAAALDAVRDAFGPIEVLAYSASTSTSSSGELEPDRLEKMWRLYAYGGLLSFREALPDLRAEGGTVLYFGAASEAGDFAFKSAKAATRGLARSLARTYGPEGIHVAHVIIQGRLLNPDVFEREDTVEEPEFIDPTGAAESCYHLVEQDDRAQTFELDLHTYTRTDIH